MIGKIYVFVTQAFQAIFLSVSDTFLLLVLVLFFEFEDFTVLI